MSKPLTQSKTAQGATVSLIVALAAILWGVDITDPELETAAGAVTALVAFGYTIYGRIMAREPIAPINPKPRI
tara:strand:+ start:4580 stop:4798 length:219 start_codon:yes stop_codon:yes gene_type:complete